MVLETRLTPNIPKANWLISGGMLCAVFFSVCLGPSSSNAECGGYVTIGNKAKLKELQAAGYLPVMKNHEKVSESGQNQFPEDSSLKSAKPLTVPPCSGPHCKSNKPNVPLPAPITLVPTTSLKPFVELVENGVAYRPSSFIGFRSFDERPSYNCLELDRPPE